MPWNSQSATQLLIINASGGFTGLFVYSPAPGTGNLIASVAAAAGTDPYGNTYLAGIVAYHGGVPQYVQMNDSQLLLKSGGSASVGILSMVGVGGFLGDLSFSGAAGYVFDQAVIGKTVAKNSAGTAAETWNTMSPLGAGFANGSATPRYRLEPDNTVRLVGVVNLTANQASLATIFTLPAGYRPPATVGPLLTANNLSGASPAQGGSFQVTSGGAIQLWVSGTNGNSIGFDGATFPLD